MIRPMLLDPRVAITVVVQRQADSLGAIPKLWHLAPSGSAESKPVKLSVWPSHSYDANVGISLSFKSN